MAATQQIIGLSWEAGQAEGGAVCHRTNPHDGCMEKASETSNERDNNNLVIVGVPREIYPGERRVGLVPMVVPNLIKAGLEVILEAGAGVEAGYPDAHYAEKGAKIVPARAAVFSAADVVVQVLGYGSNDATGAADLPLLRREQVLIGFLRPLGSLEMIQQIAGTGVEKVLLRQTDCATELAQGHGLVGTAHAEK